MRKITFVTLALAGSAALVGATTLPAFAADDTTTATVAVAGGSITISAPETVTLLNEAAPGSEIRTGTTASIGLEVSVDDARSLATDWASTVVLVPTEGSTGYLMPVSAYTYTPVAGTADGDVPATLTTLGAPADLSIVTAQQSAADVNGNNTAIWDATLTLEVPPEALAGTYAAVITHSAN